MLKSELAKIIKLVGGTYHNFRSNEDTTEAWYIILQDCPFESCYGSLLSYLRQGNDKAPTPGQLRPQGNVTCLSQTKKDTSVEDRRMDSAGFVRIRLDDGNWAWNQKSFSVFDKKKNTWRSKIDFCMDRFGAGAITNIVRQITDHRSMSYLLKTSDWIEAYRFRIDSLTNEALKIEGT